MPDIMLSMEGQLSYSDTISIAQAAQIITFLNAGVNLAPTGTSVQGAYTGDVQETAPAPTLNASSPREALDISGAKTGPEKIVALAAYLLQDGELETFTLEQIRPQFQRAREPMPKNMSRDLDAAIQSGWIHSSSTRGQFYLTSTVESVLEQSFEEIRTKKGSSPRGRSAQRSRRIPLPKPETFNGIEEFPTEMRGVPNFHDIKTKRDKMLWTIKSAKEAGFASLTHKEIAWLTDHFGEAILVNHVGVNFGYLQKAGLANKNTEGKIRILPRGETYLLSLGNTEEKGA